jgi:hypothetical protein
MPPGVVGDYLWRPSAIANPASKLRHVTILLNAAMPPAQRGATPIDRWVMLLSMFSSLAEQMPEASLRVIAFDTDQQRELFRADDFKPEQMNELAHVANAKERWAVNYQVLQNPSGGWDLLRDLENGETHTTTPADTVVFLGVPNGRFDKMPSGMPGPDGSLRFFYLKYTRPVTLPQARGDLDPRQMAHMGLGNVAIPGATEQPDRIEQAVGHIGGKTIPISSPASFGKAIAAIQKPVSH